MNEKINELVKLTREWAYAFSDGSNRDICLNEIEMVGGGDLAGDLKKMAENAVAIEQSFADYQDKVLDNLVGAYNSWTGDDEKSQGARIALSAVMNALDILDEARCCLEKTK